MSWDTLPKESTDMFSICRQKHFHSIYYSFMNAVIFFLLINAFIPSKSIQRVVSCEGLDLRSASI